jgi:hypothetical protein
VIDRPNPADSTRLSTDPATELMIANSEFVPVSIWMP